MSYENAPATKMVATHCACCGRPLVDAASVETGIGPECRKKHGFDIPCTDEARVEANKLVYLIAAKQDGPEVAEHCKALFALGFAQLVLAVLKRVATIRISITDDTHPHGAGRFAVVTPYSEQSVTTLRTIPGRRFYNPKKAGKPGEPHNTFPREAQAALWQAFQILYPGATAVGPKGPFVVAFQKKV